MSQIMAEHYLIQDIITKFTHDIASEVEFKYLRPHLMPIFPLVTLQRAEGRDRANYDIMIKVCDSVRTLSMKDFLLFMDAIKKDYSHVFDKVNDEYKRKTGSYLPTIQRSRDDDIEMTAISELPSQQPIAPQTIESLGRQAHSAVSMDESQQRQVSPSETISSSSAGSAVSPSANINYRSLGPAVPCPSDQISRHGNTILLDNPAQPTSATAENYQSSMRSSTLPNQNLPPSSGFAASQNYNEKAVMIKKYYRKIRENPSSVYKMDSTPRGYCIIINNEKFEHLSPRAGSNKDSVYLCKMFKFLSFEVSHYMDKTAAEMKVLLNEFASISVLKETSALAVVILSHGASNDCIFGQDGALIGDLPVPGTFITKFELQQIFTRKNCPSMTGKPKLFVLQACRGAEEDMREKQAEEIQRRGEHSHGICLDDSSVGLTASDDSTQGNLQISETADMIFLHSSSLGYKAYRSKYDGSPFVKSFTERVIQNASEKSIHRIIMTLQNEFSTFMIGTSRMTMPEYSSSLTRKWYLNPPDPSD